MSDAPPNAPWVESPFFQRELAGRPSLTAGEIELVTRYHAYGYATLENVISEDLVEQVKREVQGLFRPEIEEGYASYYRVHDAWRTSPAVKDLALSEKVCSALRLLYGREPVPFQTLNFLYGSQQANHSDAILFNSMPARFMCGVWVALEDVDLESGPLFYYPGSHKLKEYYVQDFRNPGRDPDDFFGQRYPGFISELMATEGFQREQLRVKKGSALIWSSNLVHGGMPRLNKALTRWTQVTHYFFEDCIYYVPLYSNTVAGEMCLRDVTDLRTGRLVTQTFNGRKFLKTPLADKLWRIQFLEELSVPEPRFLSPVERRRSLANAVKTRLSNLRPRRADRHSSQLFFNIDAFADEPEHVSVFGWAFVPGDERDSVELTFDSGRARYVVECARMARPDVSAAFPNNPLRSGFQALIDKRPFAPGIYRVGLALRSPGREEAFRFTGKEIRVGTT